MNLAGLELPMRCQATKIIRPFRAIVEIGVFDIG